MPTYYLKTLGCPKNEVDSEKLKAYLQLNNYTEAGSKDADLLIVNSCAFIQSAKEQSLQTIFDLSEIKKPNSKLVVTGCLAQRYYEELVHELPEADLVSLPDVRFLDEIKKAPFKTSVNLRKKDDIKLDLLNYPRIDTKKSYSYVKVAEGCDRSCSFCAIPLFKGKQRSRQIDSIVQEVSSLSSKEIILVAQDLLRFGLDNGNQSLKMLLKELSVTDKLIRLLYLYPASLNEEMLDAIIEYCMPYFDLPMQHVSKRLLKLMGRAGSKEKYINLIEKIRKKVPEASIRSSFIIGFPTETEEDHDELLDFLTGIRLDWVGLFLYSDEDNTVAYGYSDKVDPLVAQERYQEALDLSYMITVEKRMQLIGQELLVICDKPGQGRSYREAPEIDGVIYSEGLKKPNQLYMVKITGANGVDLNANVIQEMLMKNSRNFI